MGEDSAGAVAALMALNTCNDGILVLYQECKYLLWPVMVSHLRLQRMYCSSKCLNDNCSKACGNIKKLLKHLRYEDANGVRCRTQCSGCTNLFCCICVRELLLHYRKCQCPQCPTCAPVRIYVKKESRETRL